MAAERKSQRQLDDLVAESKTAARKAVFEGKDRPKSIKELEEFSRQGRKAFSKGEDIHAKRTDALVQQTLERNRKLLQQAKELEAELNLASKAPKVPLSEKPAKGD